MQARQRRPFAQGVLAHSKQQAEWAKVQHDVTLQVLTNMRSAMNACDDGVIAPKQRKQLIEELGKLD